MLDFIFYILPTVLNILFCALSVKYITASFSEQKEKLWMRIVTLISGVILMSIAFLLFEKGFLRLIFLFASLFLFTFSYKAKTYLRLLLTAVSYSIISAADFISLVIICGVFSLTAEDTLKEPFFTLGIIFYFSIVLVILLIIKHVRKYITMGNFDKRILPVYILPVTSVFIIFMEYAVFCSYETTALLKLMMFIASFLLLISNFAVFTLADGLFNQIASEKKLQTAKDMIDKQSEQYRKLLNADTEIRRYRHDVKNFLTGVLYNLNENKIDDVKSSVINQIDSFKTFDKYAASKNALDALLSLKAEEASHSGVNLLWDIYSGDHPFNEIDLAVILGNLIDNAMEADFGESKNKTIHVSINYKDTLMIISVTNPVKQNIDTSRLFTTKKNKKEHGLGLLSVKSLAKKYNGSATFTCEDLTFKAVVLLYKNDDVDG